MKPKIISLSYAVPENSYSQEEVFATLSYPRHFWRIFRDSGIDRRHFWIEPYRVKEMSWQQMTEQYSAGAFELSKEAVIKCLDDRDPRTVGCLVFCSCTGFCPGPTVAHHLAREMGFSPSIYITNIISMGCEGGFPGLKRAYDYVVAMGKRALVIACEISSATYFPEPDGRPDRENDYELLRSNALFADAASAALVGFDDDPRHPYIVDSESSFNPQYIDDLGYTWRDGRLRVKLSKGVPELASLVIKSAVNALLKRQKLDISDIEWFIVHAAGSSVLDKIRDALGISEDKVGLSRKTLRLFGNTSSTSIGITGKMLIAHDVRGYALVLSVGPGMVGGATLLQFGG